MINDRDFPLPLASSAESAWAAPIEPTNLIALWPRRYEPTPAEIRTLLSRHAGGGGAVEIRAQVPMDDPKIRWTAVLEIDGFDQPVIAWCEPMRPTPPEHLKMLNAEKIKWIVGFETMLDPDDPLTAFIALLRLIGGAIADAPAILSVNTETWFTRRELDDDLLRTDRKPGSSILFVVHAIGPEPKPNEEPIVWAYTKGLARCGRPELEMLELPATHGRAAVMVLAGIAEYVLENPLPPPGEPMEIGPDLEVAFQPWRAVAPYVREGAPGAMDNRRDHAGHERSGPHAVVCAAEPIGVYRKIWIWPAEVLARVMSGDAVIYKTARATRQQAMQARATWGELAAAHAAIRAQVQPPSEAHTATVQIQAALRSSDSARNEVGPSGAHEHLSCAGGGEHLWFNVLRFDGNRAQAELLNQPRSIPGVNRGDVVWLKREDVSDWAVSLPNGTFGPREAAALQTAIKGIEASRHQGIKG